MRQAMIRRAALGAMLGALALAAPAAAKTLHGTVVHQNTSQSSFVLAARRGNLTVISAKNLPRVGRIASVKVRRVTAGTATARRVRTRGTARSAVLRGRVSFADAHSFALSANGASILIRDSGTPPNVGDNVAVRVAFGANDELDADEVNTTPAPTTRPMKIEGVIQAIDPTARTLTVTADDNEGDDNQGDDNAGAADDNPAPTVTVDVPDTIDITQFSVGDEVELLVTPEASGSFLLQAVDNNDQGDDQGNDQGDGGVQQGDDNGGDGGGNSGPGGDGSGSDG